MLQIPGVASVPRLALPALSEQAVHVSLTVTGPASIKSAMTRGVPLDLAVQTAQRGVGRAAERHTLDGGRQAMADVARNDPRSGGWVRLTSGDPCSFCSQVAAWSETNPDLLGDFLTHDGCHCAPDPVFN